MRGTPKPGSLGRMSGSDGSYSELSMVALEHQQARFGYQADPPFGGAAKRSFDVVAAAAAIVLLTPMMLLVALAVKLYDGGPILFVQRRIGHGGREFAFLKFRTMAIDASAQLRRLLDEDPQAAREWAEKQKLSRDPRVTPVGRFLRRTSLDELPQFVNVLAGQMSVVGPRPMMVDQTQAYGPAFGLYCRARPGITGLWQVSGRAETTFRRRAELDAIYLQRWSAMGDVWLMVRTVGALTGQHGAC